MKTKFCTFLLPVIVFFTCSLASAHWIVGKEYVAHWDGKHLDVKKGMAPTSSAVDSASCRLWVSDGQALQSFVPGTLTAASASGLAGRIVSTVAQERFHVWNSATGNLERRDTEGAIDAEYAVADGATLLQLAVAPGGVGWGLHFDAPKNDISLTRLDGSFGVAEKLKVADAKVIWTNPRLLLTAKGEPWVGYSSSVKKHSASPVVKRFSADGKGADEFRWEKRGLFFDFCEDGDRVLVAHDLPTMPYTVPVYSFLDALKPGANPSTVYSAPTNDFIDSLACTSEKVWMIQRSIFGSSGSSLVTWDKKASEAQVVTPLPGPAEALYLCSSN